MLKLFTRRKKTEQEIAPALTQSEQRSWRSPGPVSGTLPYHLYDQMERDGMVMAALTIKKQAVLAHSWKIVGDDQERVAFIKEVFQQMEGSPRNILFREELSAGSYSGIYSSAVPVGGGGGLTGRDGRYVVTGGNSGAFVVRDPSHGAMPMLRTPSSPSKASCSNSARLQPTRGPWCG